LVLVKEDHQIGSPVSPTTWILDLVKGDQRMGSQVNPTMQILVLVKVDHRMGSQVSPTTQRILASVKTKLKKKKKRGTKIGFSR